MTDQTGDAAALGSVPTGVAQGPKDIAESLVVPLHSEEANITRRRVETDVVRVATITHAREALVNEPLVHERVEVERIPVGRVIETTPPIREEGDTTIISVVEEIVVVQRRLVLKEEVHIRKVKVTEQHQETVVLREQKAVVSRGKPSTDTSV